MALGVSLPQALAEVEAYENLITSACHQLGVTPAQSEDKSKGRAR